MKADIVFEDMRWRKLPLEKIASASLNLIETDMLDSNKDFEISILATNDFGMIQLNEQSRGFNESTNILSWPEYNYERVKPGAFPKRKSKRFQYYEGPDFLGNIAISFDRCFIEADQRQIDVKDHITHLLIHGCLHLIGFEHEDELDATLMEETEKRLLLELGIKNPYAVNGR